MGDANSDHLDAGNDDASGDLGGQFGGHLVSAAAEVAISSTVGTPVASGTKLLWSR